MQKQVKVQELPEVQVVERIQEQVVPERMEEPTVDIPVPPIVEGSVPSVDESASPVYNQVHQERIPAEQEGIERVQQRTIEQITHVPVPQVQEQIVERYQGNPLRNVSLSRLSRSRTQRLLQWSKTSRPNLVFPVRHQFQ